MVSRSKTVILLNVHLGTNNHAGLEDCCCIAMNWKAVWLTDCKGFKRAIRRGQVSCDNLYFSRILRQATDQPFLVRKESITERARNGDARRPNALHLLFRIYNLFDFNAM